MYCLMKKIVSILFASAVAALALVSCQKETATSDVSNIKTVHFNANSIETKTAFGTLQLMSLYLSSYILLLPLMLQ